MTALASQQVIDAVVARLVAAATVAGSDVHSGRFAPVQSYPAMRVRHVDEDLSAEGDDITWPAQRLHRLQLDVEVYAQAVADLDAAMSAAVLQVLQALEGSAAPLSPLNVSLSATGIRYQAQADGQAAAGIATVRLVADFATAVNAPTTIL